MAPIQPTHPHLHGQKAGHLEVQQLFRRWPAVPTRELERIRLVLLHCDEIAHPAATHRLSEPAQALLDLVTGELERRRETGHHPLNGSPAIGHPGLPKRPAGRRRTELL